MKESRSWMASDGTPDQRPGIGILRERPLPEWALQFSR
ncbi:hypothetical protein ppKF707_1763 [Metapseudomonas furukawaii]|uniref:Uncharacterized protein n=1 Tax=Metapseudomonas furukawaii TaxID=1149133 RepID=A0AAD1FFP8_METFU|nr:hypothetical protein ppKF707_1763 [Pseudomonas furukawaii]BAU74249.1 hypothetical protein KF707C_25610 [Pseudomonas furukawaii]